jgi:bifunctional DNA-binding transcriptional regulator/antitoxin component of YhaV-PrlF toxin-antitoxin module
MAGRKKITKTILVRSQGRVAIPKKISLSLGIAAGTTLNFIEPRSKFEKEVTVQPQDRVVIPIEIRGALDIVPDTPLVFSLNADKSITVNILNEQNFFSIVVIEP